jgi:hypothetical protein
MVAGFVFASFAFVQASGGEEHLRELPCHQWRNYSKTDAGQQPTHADSSAASAMNQAFTMGRLFKAQVNHQNRGRPKALASRGVS